MRIYPIRGTSWSEKDRLELLTLLGKIGYRVSIGRERPEGKTSGAWIYYVEYEE